MDTLEPRPQASRIVVGMDFTEPSDYALAFASDLLRSAGTEAELDVVHVTAPMPIPNALGGFVASPSLALETEGTRERLANACVEAGKGTRARVVPRLVFGEVAAGLASVAREVHADLIVVGAPPHRGMAIAWHRSLSARLVRHAPCSVLAARPREVETEVKIDPPCADCLEVRRESGGTVQWCARHGEHHLHPHFHHGDPQNYVSGSWTFRS